MFSYWCGRKIKPISNYGVIWRYIWFNCAVKQTFLCIYTIHGHDIENKVNFNRGGKVMLGYEWRKFQLHILSKWKINWGNETWKLIIKSRKQCEARERSSQIESISWMVRKYHNDWMVRKYHPMYCFIDSIVEFLHSYSTITC